MFQELIEKTKYEIDNWDWEKKKKELKAHYYKYRYHYAVATVLILIIGLTFSIIVITLFNEDRFFSIPSTLIAIGSLVIGLMLMLMSVVLYSISQMSKRL